MACSFKNEEEKKRFVQRVVREAIKRIDGGHRPVTQGTYLDRNGLGHLAAKRKRYCGEINRGLGENRADCQLSGAACAAVGDSSLAMVADVTDVVLKDI